MTISSQLGINFTPAREARAARGVELPLTYPAELSPIDYAECFNDSDLVLARYRPSTARDCVGRLIQEPCRVWAIGTVSESGYFHTMANGAEPAMRREMLAILNGSKPRPEYI